MSVILDIPESTTPGYWLRQEKITDLQIAFHDARAALNTLERAGNEADPEVYVSALRLFKAAQLAVVDYILDYVAEPEDRDQARRAIKQLSEDEFTRVLEKIREGTGKSGNPTLADGNESGSQTITTE